MLAFAKQQIGKSFSNVGMARSLIWPRQTTGDSWFCAGVLECSHPPRHTLPILCRNAMPNPNITNLPLAPPERRHHPVHTPMHTIAHLFWKWYSCRCSLKTFRFNVCSSFCSAFVPRFSGSFAVVLSSSCSSLSCCQRRNTLLSVFGPPTISALHFLSVLARPHFLADCAALCLRLRRCQGCFLFCNHLGRLFTTVATFHDVVPVSTLAFCQGVVFLDRCLLRVVYFMSGNECQDEPRERFPAVGDNRIVDGASTTIWPSNVPSFVEDAVLCTFLKMSGLSDVCFFGALQTYNCVQHLVSWWDWSLLVFLKRRIDICGSPLNPQLTHYARAHPHTMFTHRLHLIPPSGTCSRS